jgi:hypothetical protein
MRWSRYSPGFFKGGYRTSSGSLAIFAAMRRALDHLTPHVLGSLTLLLLIMKQLPLSLTRAAGARRVKAELTLVDKDGAADLRRPMGGKP